MFCLSQACFRRRIIIRSSAPSVKKFITRSFSQTLTTRQSIAAKQHNYYLLGGIVQVFGDQIKVKYGFLVAMAFVDIGNWSFISPVFTWDSREFGDISRQEHEIIKRIMSFPIFFQPFSSYVCFSQYDDFVWQEKYFLPGYGAGHYERMHCAQSRLRQSGVSILSLADSENHLVNEQVCQVLKRRLRFQSAVNHP